MKDENRGTVSQSASAGSTAKSEAVTYEKPWGVHEVLFFLGGVGDFQQNRLQRTNNAIGKIDNYLLCTSFYINVSTYFLRKGKPFDI